MADVKSEPDDGRRKALFLKEFLLLCGKQGLPNVASSWPSLEVELTKHVMAVREGIKISKTDTIGAALHPEGKGIFSALKSPRVLQGHKQAGLRLLPERAGAILYQTQTESTYLTLYRFQKLSNYRRCLTMPAHRYVTE